MLIRKLKHFQDLGHTVIFLVGDFTSLIGDPTGRSATRKPLTSQEIAENAKTYTAQIFKILDGARTEIRFNSEWLSPLGFEGMIRLAAKFTVSQMLEREEFHRRFNKEQPIPCTKCSIRSPRDMTRLPCARTWSWADGPEIQPSDRPRIAAPLRSSFADRLDDSDLEGLDGVQKMSKSLGNAIGIHEPPQEMYGKLMSISDELMWRYWTLLTDLRQSEVERMRSDVAAGSLHPMEVKKQLARTIVAGFHSEDAAREADEDWARQFQQRDLSAMARR